MRSSIVRTSFAALLLAGTLAGCNRAESPPASQPATPSATDDAATVPEAPDGDDAMVTMRYACDGNRVAVFGNDHATVTMDGRDIDLAFVAGSSPPRYSGEALEFSVGADGAVLGQDEGASWTCTAE